MEIYSLIKICYLNEDEEAAFYIRNSTVYDALELFYSKFPASDDNIGVKIIIQF